MDAFHRMKRNQVDDSHHSIIVMGFELHIGVLAFPFGSHAPPLLSLVRRLAASSPATLFSFFNSAPSNAALFTHNPYHNIRPYDVPPPTGTLMEAVTLFINASPANFDKLIQEAEHTSGLKICCLLTDAFLWFACDMAEERGVPWLPFWTSALFSLSIHLYTDHIRKAVGSTGAKQELSLSFIPGLEMATSSDIQPEIILDGSAPPSPLGLITDNMVEKLPRATAFILNCFEEMDPIITKDLKSKFRHFLNVGPSVFLSPSLAAADDKTGCLSWLHSQEAPKSVVYISFGTMITPQGNELAALAQALEICGFPFLWSLKDYAQKSLPHGFLDRTKELGKIVPWAPQLQVLAHESVGVFINHGGWNSVVESIYSCVPLICRPFFGDHNLNSRMVQDSWKIGVRVKGGVFTESETVECLHDMMRREAGMKMRENVSVLKEKAMAAVEPDGSSSKNFNKLLQIMGATESS